MGEHLPDWLIERLKRQEQEKKEQIEQPRVYVEIPVPCEQPVLEDDDKGRGRLEINIMDEEVDSNITQIFKDYNLRSYDNISSLIKF